jgi:hypothetical protein
VAVSKLTLAFGVATVVPFALAIHATVAPADDAYGLDFDGSARRAAERERRYEERAAEVAARKQALTAERATRHHALHELYGDLPGQPGALFGGRLGPPRAQHPTVLDYVVATYDGNGGDLEVVRVTPNGDTAADSCVELDTQLHAAWLPGIHIADSSVWLDRDHGVRAVFEENSDCSLRFERFLTVAQLLTDDQSSVIPALGTDLEALEARLGANAVPTGNTINWHAPALGAGVGQLELIAMVGAGRITGLTVAGTTDPDSFEALQAALVRRYGRLHQEGQSARWDKPQVTLWHEDDQFTLSMGSLAESAR